MKINQCNDNLCCCKCEHLKILKSMGSSEYSYCCTLFAYDHGLDTGIVVPFGNNYHGLCECYTKNKLSKRNL